MGVSDIVDGMSKYFQSDGKADYITLIEGVAIIRNITSLILGLLVMIISIGLPIVVAIEVCYINFPPVQHAYDNLYNRLEGKANTVFGLVIRDARISIERAHTTHMGENVNWIYLKIKCKQVFLAVFIIVMVMVPGSFLLEQAFILVNGIIGWLF